jgi:hypothetical protein
MYFGSRAQLESEGVIPTGTEWPEGKQPTEWETGQFKFRLYRARPEGFKGSIKLVDYWRLSWTTTEQDYGTKAIKQKKAELKRLKHRYSPEGCAEHEARFGRYLRAQEDEAFQAFLCGVQS